ncbi:MAG: lysozyme inhibitor LprI family protein [Gammaproteobacteria bacterium]|nr:lysozyme inhibitor LprI family protein [Gammaproteobacteria bacterium]
MNNKNNHCRHYSVSARLVTALILQFMMMAVVQASASWQGEWKINNKEQYMAFTIDNARGSTFRMDYDEGIGINGLSFTANGSISGNTATVPYTDRSGSSCQLKLELLEDSGRKRIKTSNCALSQYNEGAQIHTFVPESEKLFYKAGFNCAKAGTPIELMICNTQSLADADRTLGSLYKALKQSLAGGDKKQLGTHQRDWLKHRDSQCGNMKADALEFCLRKHYGKRLMQLHAQKHHGISHQGGPSHAFYQAVHAASGNRNNTTDSMMDQGLGLWLGGRINRRLADTGSYEMHTVTIDDNLIVMEGMYASDPSKGFDPASQGNGIIIVMTKTKETWVGLNHYGETILFHPRNRDAGKSPQAISTWLKEYGKPELKAVF